MLEDDPRWARMDRGDQMALITGLADMSVMLAKEILRLDEDKACIAVGRTVAGQRQIVGRTVRSEQARAFWIEAIEMLQQAIPDDVRFRHPDARKHDRDRRR